MQVIGNLQLKGSGYIQNFRVENIAADPATPLTGQAWFNTTSHTYKYFDGTEVQTFANLAALQAFINDMASTATGKGAALVGIEDAGSYFTGTTVEAALQEIGSASGALTEVTGAADTTELVYLEGSETSTAGLVNGDSLLAAIKKLDDQLNSASAFTLQDVYNNSEAKGTAGAKFAEIKLATDKDFRIVDDSDNTVFFQIDSETGKVSITGDLEVTGTTTTIESTTTEVDHIKVSAGAAGTVGIEVRPDAGITPTASAIAYYGSNAAATPVFSVDKDGNIVLADNLTVDGVDVSAFKSAYDTFVADLATADTAAKGANMVAIQDANSHFTATTVEGALDELYAAVTAATSFEYDGTATAAASHTVTHNLNQRVLQVVVLDEDYKVVIPDEITYTSTSALTVTFSEATKCRVYVSK